MKTLQCSVALLSCAIMAGCAVQEEPERQEPTGEEEPEPEYGFVTVVAKITDSGNTLYAPLNVTVPDRVTTGEPFEVRMTTYGSRPEFCTAPSHQEIEPRKGGLRITPYDEWYTGACYLGGRPSVEEHRVEVVLDEPGEQVIHIFGVDGSTLAPEPEYVTAEYLVTVDE